ncbi:MAG: tripartite tricarboxylate transporter substrate binding protein [Hyphomicrobiales bacterium]|nr:tripartite tricarboxylate transporter substrate binding protein [Hyphomicrobiales bacterium]
MTLLSRRLLLAFLLMAGPLSDAAKAQTDFPNRSVRIVVGFAPGGTTDILARVIGEKLNGYWGVPVVVENRPGADGIIATTLVFNAPPDGYTLLMSTNALVITPHLRSLPYDPIKDFEPITIVGQEYHHLMVTPSLPAKTVKEFIALAKSKSGGLSFSSAGPGSAPFLGMQRFIQAAGIPGMVHVPYSGSMPAVLALVSGDVQAMFSSPSTTLSIAREGKVRILGVAGPTRDPNVPDIPTIAESGLPGFQSNTWFGLVASSKVPSGVLARIREGVARAMRSPDVLKRIADVGSRPVGNTAEEFRQVIKDDLETYRQVVTRIR